MSKAKPEVKGTLAGLLAPKKTAIKVAELQEEIVVQSQSEQKKSKTRQHISTNIAFPENVRKQMFKWLAENPEYNQRTLVLKALSEFGFDVDEDDLKPGRKKYF